jgi:ABC-type phosphate transport system permease subunit
MNNGTSWNVFADGLATLPSYIFGFLGSVFDSSQSRAWGGGLVLMILVAVIFAGARFVSRSKSLKSKPTKQKASK